MRLAQGRSWPPPSLSSSLTLAAIARRLSLAVRVPCGVDPLDLHSISRFCPAAQDASDPGQSRKFTFVLNQISSDQESSARTAASHLPSPLSCFALGLLHFARDLPHIYCTAAPQLALSSLLSPAAILGYRSPLPSCAGCRTILRVPPPVPVILA